MHSRAKLIAALGASAIAGFVFAALVLPGAYPAASEALAATPDNSATPICGGASAAAVPFYSEMAAIDMRMHEGMQVVPSGNVDRDFMQMMIPHHQGAIDMALVLLKYGGDEKVRRLAQSIVVEQGQEIATMRAILDPPAASPSEATHTAHTRGH